MADNLDVPAFGFTGGIHEGVPVESDKLEDCIKFYIDVLGLKLLPRPPALDKLGPGAWLGDEDDTVQFHLIANDHCALPETHERIEPDGRHTALRIKDVDAFRARMDALGIEYGELASLIGEPQLFVKDPQGHVWEFQGPPGSNAAAEPHNAILRIQGKDLGLPE